MKKIPYILLGLVAAVIGWRILSLGLASHFAVDDPELALQWRSHHPEAGLQAARRHAEAKDWAAATVDAERALKARPLDGRPLAVLAQAADAAGDKQQAALLYQKAVRWAPRDLPTRVWLLQHALQNRDAAAAVVHMDALLRLQPQLLEQLQPQANLLAVTPQARPALLKTLAAGPPWRTAFLAGLARSDDPIDAIAPLFAGLNTTPETPISEIDPWLSRLRQEGRALQAYVTWVTRVPESQRTALGNVFDGGFEIPQDEQPGMFAWQTPGIAGATAYWSANRGTLGENSYVVEFEGRRTPFAHLYQALAIPPGQWKLTWRAKALDLNTERGLIWQIYCEPSGAVLLESPPMRGQFEWREQSAAFSVPPECQGQLLRLLIPARIPAETAISGMLWLDGISITPAKSSDMPKKLL